MNDASSRVCVVIVVVVHRKGIKAPVRRPAIIIPKSSRPIQPSLLDPVPDTSTILHSGLRDVRDERCQCCASTLALRRATHWLRGRIPRKQSHVLGTNLPYPRRELYEQVYRACLQRGDPDNSANPVSWVSDFIVRLEIAADASVSEQLLLIDLGGKFGVVGSARHLLAQHAPRSCCFIPGRVGALSVQRHGADDAVVRRVYLLYRGVPRQPERLVVSPPSSHGRLSRITSRVAVAL